MKRKHNKTVLCAFVSGSVFGAVLVIAMSGHSVVLLGDAVRSAGCSFAGRGQNMGMAVVRYVLGDWGEREGA
ncbi:hypothetical protein, partial [Vibrio alginolyticus]|uniref:hypothetical protein n=1 Tax=Vibrio alginolyticus TaxID=663 RepID=UPI001EEC978F